MRLTAEVPVEAVQVVLGIREDPSFGALATFGVGGVVSELLGDRAFAPVPLTDVDAARLIRGPRALPLLTGYDGRVAADLAALEELALRLSTLSDALPELAYCRLDAYAGAGRRLRVGSPGRRRPDPRAGRLRAAPPARVLSGPRQRAGVPMMIGVRCGTVLVLPPGRLRLWASCVAASTIACSDGGGPQP